MGIGGIKTMVRILMIFILFITEVQAETYKLFWSGPQNGKCQNLVESFLKEFKNISNNETIEFNIGKMTNQNSNFYQLTCDQHNINQLNVLNNDKIYSLHYLGKSAGFDPLDWLEIQKYAMHHNRTERAFLLETTESKETTTLDTEKSSIWTPIIIGTTIGALSGAVFSPDSLNRPLNALVFGLAGGAAGGLYAYWKF